MISIVTPTYNRSALLQKTIESILKQTYTDWELIIVDDGSTDDTEQVVQQYLTRNNIRYIKKENSGATHTRNVGASYARGNFITFLDSDDEAFPNWLEIVCSRLDEHTGLASVGAVRCFTDGTTIREMPQYKELFGKNIGVRYPSIIVNKKVFNEVGGFDVNLKASQFTDICFRIFIHLKDSHLNVVTINECLIKVNIHQGPRIRTNWKQVKEGSIQFIDKHYHFLKETDSDGHISNIYSVIAFSNYKLKQRQQSINYLIKAIKHNPSNLKNYFKIIKYAVL